MSDKLGERAFGSQASTAFVVGTVVGTGIYLKPASVAKLLPETWQVLLLWLVVGLFATAGAVVYATLARNWPHTGGPYLYLEKTYGTWAASLLLAADILVARPAAVGALATGLGLVWGLTGEQNLILAITALLCLSGIQLRGAKFQGMSQIVLTLLQLLPLLAVLLLSLAWGKSLPLPDAEVSGTTEWATAFLAILWAYDGWYNITILGGEVREPGRTIGRALVGGMTLVILLYLSLNIVLYRGLSGEAIASSSVAFVTLLDSWGISGLGVFLQLALSFALLATLQGTLACGSRMIVAGVSHGLVGRAFGQEPTGVRPTLGFSFYCVGLLLLFAGLALERNLFDSLSELTAVVVTLLSALTVTCLFHASNFSFPVPRLSKMCGGFYLSVSLLLSVSLVNESHTLALAGSLTVLMLGSLLWVRRRTA